MSNESAQVKPDEIKLDAAPDAPDAEIDDTIETTYIDLDADEDLNVNNESAPVSAPVSALAAPASALAAPAASKPEKKLYSLKDLTKFYEGREKNPDSFEYDESGNLVQRNKREIIKTIYLPTYRPVSLDERKQAEDQRMQNIEQKNDEFDRARQALYDAYQNSNTTRQTILELNREVARADVRLKYESNAHQHVFLHYSRMPSEPPQYRIQMKDLHFKNANEDKAVYDTIAILQTRPLSLLLETRINDDAPEMVDLYKAKANAEIREQKEAGLRDVLSQLNKKSEEQKVAETLSEKIKLKSHGYQYLAYQREIPTVKPPPMSMDELMKRVKPKPKSKPRKISIYRPPTSTLAAAAATVAEPADELADEPVAEPAAAAAEPVESAAIPSATPSTSTTDVVKPKPRKISIYRPPTEEKLPSAEEGLKKKVNVGRVFIASKTPPRQPGKRVDPPTPMKAVDVTSGQATESETRRDFSPMTPVEGGYKGYWNFEHYWQSGKVFEGVDVKTAKAWWKKQVEPKRRYPGSKDLRVLHACWDPSCSDKMDWVTSRKRVYVPEYFEYMKDRPSAIALRDYVASGKDVVVYDYDGPRNPDRSNSIMEVTVENLQEKINATDFPFGHGYIVAAWLKGITPDQYS